MSIIFDALHKLKATSGRSGQKAGGKSRQGEYTVGRALLSPKLILAVLLVAFVGGVLIMGAVEHLRVSLQEDRSETEASGRNDRQGNVSMTEPPAKNGLSYSAEGEMPPPPESPENAVSELEPDMSVAVVTTPGRLILPPKRTPSVDVPPAPDIDAGSPTSATEKPFADAFPPPSATTGSVRGAPNTPRSQSTAIAEDLGAVGGYHILQPQRVRPPADAEEAGGQVPEARKESQPDGGENTGLYREAVDGSEVETYPSTEASIAERDAANRKAEKAYQAKLAARMEMVRLVTSLRGALKRGEETKAEALLSELTRIKGDDDPYVMKMTAYWHIRKEDYPAAESLLTRCLAASDHDVEAELNMAVVESRTGRMEAALSRISRLAARYPNDRRIQALRQTLK